VVTVRRNAVAFKFTHSSHSSLYHQWLTHVTNRFDSHSASPTAGKVGHGNCTNVVDTH
jgi:hypothetical protein